VSLDFFVRFCATIQAETYRVQRPYDVNNPDANTVSVPGRELTTSEVVYMESGIKQQCRELQQGKRYVDHPKVNEADVWRPGLPKFSFISHAWENPFVLLLDTLTDHFNKQQADFRSIYVWIDIFASA